MADIVSLDERRLPVDAELVSLLKIILSDATNGKVRSFHCLMVTADGVMTESYKFGQPVDQLVIESCLKADDETE